MSGLKLSVSRSAGLSPIGRILAAVGALLLFAGVAGCVVAFTGVELSAGAAAAGLAGALVAAALGCFVAGRDRLELRAYGVAGALVIAVAAVMGLAGGGLLEGGAQFANALLVRIGEHTQEYALPYRAGGEESLVTFCALAGLADGLVCSLLAQRGIVVPALALAAAALAGVVSGWVPVGWWALALAIGVLACLCARSTLVNDRAARSSYAWALACTLVACALVGGVVGLATRGAPVDVSQPNGAIAQMLWNMEYGDAVFAMPEGRLGGLGSLKASDQQAMDVTVDVPTYEYLRGFVGGSYTGDAWVPIGSDTVMDNRGLLYWLERDGLLGASQLSVAAGLVDYDQVARSQFKQTMHSVRKPYAYLPYGYVDGAQAHATTDLSQMRVGGAGGQEAAFDPSITRKAYLLQDTVDGAQADADDKAANGAGLPGADGDASDAASDAAPGGQADGQAGTLRTYLDDNAAYREFASAQFGEVPEETAELFAKLYGPPVELTTEQAKIQVLALLDDTVGYSDDPKALEDPDETGKGGSQGAAGAQAGVSSGQAAESALDDGDFLTRFLTITRSGYSVHYATAAALLMRYYGVPARYVEGYVLNTAALDKAAAEEGAKDAGEEGAAGGSSDGAADAGADGSGSADDDATEKAPFLGTYTLTEQQAHAWVEYYLDGVGWVPFDVTPGWRNPGFYETTDNAQLVDDSQNWSVGEADQNTVWTPPEAEEEQAEEESDKSAPMFGELEFLFVLWPWVLAGFLITLYLAFFVRGSILRARLREFLAQASDESVAPEQAVPALFSYLVMLVQKCGGEPLANAPFAAQGAALEEAGLCSADLFERAARANDRVLFAGEGAQVDREDALAVLECVKSVRAGLGQQLKPLQRFWQRDVRCLW